MQYSLYSREMDEKIITSCAKYEAINQEAVSLAQRKD